MPIIGLVGGIAPESTIAYYRLLVEGHLGRDPGSYPRVVINSIDLTRMLRLVGAGDTKGLTEYLAEEVERLVSAGAAFAGFGSNTPHLVFDAVASRVSIPLVSIVQATAAEAAKRGCFRLGLLGTRFTMEGSFYPEVLSAMGISVHPPNGEDRDYVHRVYLGELAMGVFRPETRAGLLGVIERLRAEHAVDAVVLGGTELPLILGADTASPVPLIDTTRVHVAALLERAFAPSPPN